MHTSSRIRSTGPGRIRRINRGAVLSQIRTHGPQPRSALGRALTLSGAAVSSVVSGLLEDGFLREQGGIPRSKRQGRPTSLLELHPDAAYALGIVIRPEKTCVTLGLAWANYAGDIHLLPTVRVDNGQDYNSLADEVVRAVNTLYDAVPLDKRVVGLTIAVPGVVENDTIPMSPKLPCLQGTGFIKDLRQRLGLPVSFYNDVNLAAMSEMAQQPRLRDLSFAYLYLYAGVGSGISLQGKLYTGSAGWAGEIGPLHIHRHASDSASFESRLSTDGRLADLLESLGHPRDALDALCPLIDQRDQRVLQVIDDYCEHLSDAINVLNCVLDLDEVLVDFRSDNLFKRLRPRIEIRLQSAPRQPVISTPALGGEATLNGAALTALRLACETLETGGDHMGSQIP